MENVFENKYINALFVWKQKNESLKNTIKEYHDLLQEDMNDMKEFNKNEDIKSFSLIDQNEVNFVKMLKRLNEIIDYLLTNSDKVIKYDILQKICTSYYDIDGIETLRLDRIFKLATTEDYKRSYNMIQQYFRMIERLINKFKAEIIEEKEFIDKGCKM